jgi:putative sugar O-methyltransferase
VQLNSHEILRRFNRMLEEIDPVLQKRWGDNHDHSVKRSMRLNEDVIERFGAYAIGGIGFEGGVDLPMFDLDPDGTPVALKDDRDFDRDFLARVRHSLPDVWRHLKKFEWLSEETRLELIKDEGSYGGRKTQVAIEGKKVLLSVFSIRVAPRVAGLRQALGHWPSTLLEIGGGHGRFIRDVATCSPDTKFFYCDLPFNMALAASYLRRQFPEQVNLVWSPEDRVDPEKTINIIAPWRLMELPQGVEVCCNFLSFQHMSRENLAYYGEILNARSVRSIYHENRRLKLHPGEIDLSDYPLHQWYRIMSEQVFGYSSVKEVQTSTLNAQLLRRVED